MTLNISDFSCFESPPWLPVVQQILGGQARLQHFGCMMSLPSSATQNWHSDGPHRSKHTHLPAYMLNCFVPLVDMTRALGGTQIQPGSHVHHDFMIRTTCQKPTTKTKTKTSKETTNGDRVLRSNDFPHFVLFLLLHVFVLQP